MPVENTRLPVTNSQNLLVQTKITKAFDDQVSNLVKYGGPNGRIGPDSATRIFLGAIAPRKAKDNAYSFTYSKAELQALKESPTREALNAISKENLVFSAYSFLDSLNQVDPRRRHIKDRELADFIQGPVFKQALNILFANELRVLTERDLTSLAEDTVSREASRQKQVAIAKAPEKPEQFTIKPGKAKLIDLIPLAQREEIVDRVFDAQDETDRITRDDFKRIVVDTVAFTKTPNDRLIRQLSEDLGFGQKDYKNAKRK